MKKVGSKSSKTFPFIPSKFKSKGLLTNFAIKKLIPKIVNMYILSQYLNSDIKGVS